MVVSGSGFWYKFQRCVALTKSIGENANFVGKTFTVEVSHLQNTDTREMNPNVEQEAQGP